MLQITSCSFEANWTHRKSGRITTESTRRTIALMNFGPASNYRVVPWIISTSSVDQIMELTYLPWVVEVPYLKNIIVDSPNAFNHLMSGKDGAPSKIHPVL